jgi:hypothetical protein
MDTRDGDDAFDQFGFTVFDQSPQTISGNVLLACQTRQTYCIVVRGVLQADSDIKEKKEPVLIGMYASEVCVCVCVCATDRTMLEVEAETDCWIVRQFVGNCRLGRNGAQQRDRTLGAVHGFNQVLH